MAKVRKNFELDSDLVDWIEEKYPEMSLQKMVSSLLKRFKECHANLPNGVMEIMYDSASRQVKGKLEP